MNKIIFVILFLAPTTWCNIWDILQHRKVKPPTAAGCTLSLVKTYPNEPIVVDSRYKFIYPNGLNIKSDTQTLKIGNGQSITIACLGSSNEIVDKNSKRKLGQKLKLTCNAGSLKNGNVDYTPFVNSLNCTTMVENTVQISVGTDICGGANSLNKCGDANRKNPTLSLDVGFVLDTNFVKLYCVCFDASKKYPVFTHYVVNQLDFLNSVPVENNMIKPKFTEDKYYYFSCDNLYKNQQKNINNLLRLPSSSTKYIDPKNGEGLELNRGHLVPNAGFVYATQKKATFHYINAAPQWHFFNSGNWEKVEKAVVRKAQGYQDGFNVYTGVSGSEPAQLKKENTLKETDLYLNTIGSYENTVPVPKFYWKLVHDAEHKKAVVFVGHNNPHEHPFDYNNIKDFCSKVTVSWVTLEKPLGERDDVGFTAVCEYNDKIKTHFPDMPKVDASKGILY